MATTITMPKLGLTMTSGSVKQWNKKIGDTVKKGELLYVVATDKLTVEVECPADGVLLAITVQEGQDVPVGAPLGMIGAPGENVAAPPAPTVPVPTVSAPISAPASTTAHRKAASPKAKKLARERGIDISTLQGTGPNGWVVARDILGHETHVKASPVAAKMAAEHGMDIASFDTGKRVMKADVQARFADARLAEESRVPVTQMRRVISERMLQSHTSIPSVNYFADVDMSALNELRAAYNERLRDKRIPVKVSVNDILMKFCAKLLMENPMVNASVETADGLNKTPSAFILHDFVNIGFAVALPGGLLVPNVKNVHIKGVAQIAEERAELVEKARSGALLPDQMTGGTFTISNLGMIGVGAFTPLINPPEAAILGVGTTMDKPVAVDGAITIRPVAAFCLTADHRLVDGADGAAFLARLKELVEQPDLFLL